MTPSVAVLFRQTVKIEADEEALVRALQSYVDTLLKPCWGVSAQVRIDTEARPGDWPLVFADDSDQAGALGYHDDGPAAGPCGFVFVRTTQAAGERVPVAASHELAEMLLDPACNRGAWTPRQRWVAWEICDPVQGTTIPVNGFDLANFVLPSWFGAGGFPYDAGGACSQPWQILDGGYVAAWEGDGWYNIFGSTRAALGFQVMKKAGPLRRCPRRRRAGPQGCTNRAG